MRCVNCGINFDSVGFITLKYVPNVMDEIGAVIQKLKDWLKPFVLACHENENVIICDPCYKLLLTQKKRRVRSNVCIGCGAVVSKDSMTLSGYNLQECRSWAPSNIYINHLDKVCELCYQKLIQLQIFKPPRLIKETVYVRDEAYVPMDKHEVVVKLEPESGDGNNLKASDNDVFGNENIKENDQNNEDKINSKDDQDMIEEFISVNGIKEELNGNGDIVNEHYEDENDQNNDNNSISNESEQDMSEAESLSNVNIKKEPDYTNYEFLEDTDISNSSTHKKVAYKGQPESDDDYIPPCFLKIENIPKRADKDVDYIPPSCLRIEDIPKHDNIERKEAIELENYKRTVRIAHCVFNECINDCVALIPRTVRRDMIIEYNTYIPRHSKVCKEHLEDQNWEDLAFSKTTSIFRAEYCQDMKNVMTEFCRTNFDFENIDTVDCKLVRYWFDINKGDFKRIFSYFPKLKRLKESRTAFAVYLMYLQKTSIERIALLLRIKEKIVKRRIIFVRDVVKCSNYEELKDKFLPDD